MSRDPDRDELAYAQFVAEFRNALLPPVLWTMRVIERVAPINPHVIATYRWHGPGGRRRTLFLYTNGRVQLVAENLHWRDIATDPAPAWRPTTWLAMRRQLTTP